MSTSRKHALHHPLNLRLKPLQSLLLMAYFVAPTFNRHFGIKIPILARPNCAGTRMGHSRDL
jgi:hypothetical protein